MTTITLPEHLASTRLLAGIEFTDGTAHVERLGTHARRFLELTGATISGGESPFDVAASAVAENAEAVAALQAGGKLLADCTIAELRDIAKTEGINLPAKATKPEILHAFLMAFHEED